MRFAILDLRFAIGAVLAMLCGMVMSMAASDPQSQIGNRKSAITGPLAGTASWYGEEHRGRLMANGKRFDPDQLTCASWFYPLGTRLRVSNQRSEGVVVVVTDRGPARRLVRDGRIVDLSRAAFARLAGVERGLVRVGVGIADCRLPIGDCRSDCRSDCRLPIANRKSQIANRLPYAK